MQTLLIQRQYGLNLSQKLKKKARIMSTDEWVDAMSIISDGLSAVTEGCRLPVRMKKGDFGGEDSKDDPEEWPKAEILSMRTIDGINQYYVHFVDYNKRLDEWVTEDRLDTRRIEPPSLKVKIICETFRILSINSCFRMTK